MRKLHGREVTEVKVIEEKYHIRKQIGSGKDCMVYLAEHRTMHRNCIIKCMSKQMYSSGAFQREAGLLRNLNNIYVPILYDCDEDENYWYLIEEYIDGLSLKGLRQQQGRFSQKMLMELAINICDAMISLHSQKPNPVLYLDLKPEHIIPKQGKIRLLDLGSAMYLRGSELTGTVSGTIGFAAPEQLQGGSVDQRADIYSIGAVFYWLMTGETADYEGRKTGIDGYSGRWNAIVSRCMEPDREKRYQSVVQLRKEIQSAGGKKQKGQFTQSLKVAVIGSQSRVGVTHFCLGMAAYCCREGITCLYEEKNDSGAIQQLAERMAAVREEQGVYHIHGVEAVPRYGQAVAQSDYPHRIVLWDCGYGSEMEEACLGEADYIIALAGGREWEMYRTKELIERYRKRDNVCYVLRIASESRSGALFKELGVGRIFCMPEYGMLFHLSGRARSFYRHLCRQLLRKK